MNDESEDLASNGETVSTQSDDKRFEPKWTKKSESIKTHEVPIIEAEEMADLRRQLEEEQQRTKELRDKWQRAAADLVNLRKRTEQDKQDLEKFASMLVVAELLPVLDNFERALATVPGNLAMLTWIHGMMLIERHLRAILEQQGLAAIEAVGKHFDPRYHEAVSERESGESSPGTVLQEYQKGYTMHGRVIRPALVEVAKSPTAEKASDPEPKDEPLSHKVSEADGIAEAAEIENSGP